MTKKISKQYIDAFKLGYVTSLFAMGASKETTEKCYQFFDDQHLIAQVVNQMKDWLKSKPVVKEEKKSSLILPNYIKLSEKEEVKK